MPKSDWIQNAELIPEYSSYKVDASGRVVIPQHMKNKFKISNGDFVEYYTAFIEGKWFICVRKDEERTRIEKAKEAARAAAEAEAAESAK